MEAIVSRDFVGALLQLNAEKQVSREQLIGAVEDGIQSAYRRVAGDEDIHVRIDAESGRIRVFRARLVVDEIEDELTQITVDEARRRTSPSAKVGDLVETEQLDGDVFGRIGAQTAKQIVLQRIREVERDQVFDQFANREGELITGTVNRVEPRAIILDVGKNVEAILATTEQSSLEHYRIGQNVKAFVLEVRRSVRGPADLREPDPQGLPATACSSSRSPRSTAARSRSRPSPARPAAAPRSRSRRARTGSTRSARPSASAAPASRPSSPSLPARRSTSSRGATTPASSWPTP